MREYNISKPIWYNRSIGIADYRLTDDLLVSITYKDQHGNRVWPDKYLVTKDFANQYPKQNIKGNNLHIIPINDLRVAHKPNFSGVLGNDL